MSDIEAMALRQRDEAVTANGRLQTDLALARQENTQLKNRIETTSTERDHWMRFATALVEKLSIINMTIDDAMKSAKTHMFQPAAVVVPRPAPEIDTKGLEKLIRRLPVNGGGDAAVDK